MGVDGKETKELFFWYFSGVFFYPSLAVVLTPASRNFVPLLGSQLPGRTANRFFVSGLRIKLSWGLLQPQILHGFLVWIAESRSVARELSGHIKFIRQSQANLIALHAVDGNAWSR